MQSSRIAEILRSARALGEPIHVTGVLSSARAWLAARYLRESGKLLVVVCPDDEAALEFASDFEALSPLTEGAPLRALVFPTWEQSPYSPIAPSIRTRLSRLAVLGSLQSGCTDTVIITSLPAAAQATLPRALLVQHSLEIKQATSVGS